MPRTTLFSLLPYIFAIAVSLLVSSLVWKRRHASGVSALLWFILAGNLFTLLYALELVSPTREVKLMWGNLRFLVTAFGPLTVLNFCLKFTQRKIRHPKILWGLLLVWPTIFIFLLLTNQYHDLIYPPESLTFVAENAALGYTMPLTTWLLIYYSLGVAAVGAILLVVHFFTVRRIFRLQILTLLMGIFLPFIGVILSLMHKQLFYKWDPSYFLVILGNLFLVWGLYRYQLFDIVPIAREILFENIHDGIVVLDMQQRIVDINPIATQYLNLGKMAVVGSHISAILPTAETLFQKLNENGSSMEIQLTRGDEKRDIEIRNIHLQDASGVQTGILLMLYDITVQKQYQLAIESANKKLQELNANLNAANADLEKLSKAKDEFISNISHELLSPLSNIRLNHGLLALRPESSSRYLEILDRETARLTAMIESLLLISRIEQQQIQPQKSAFDLNQLLLEYATDRQSLAEEHGLSLHIDLDNALPPLLADRTMIGQIISIILTNAINYTPSGGKITTTSSQRKEMGRSWIEFSIADTGIGIPPEEQANVFKRFTRGAAIHQLRVTGTGLGLAIAKELVELHDGEIQLKSSGIAGEGSQFIISLPA